MVETKKFPARVLLTVTTGRLLTKGKGERYNGIGDLYELLGWMTNDSPFTHQLGRFAEECKLHLICMFPELEKAESEEVLALLDTQIADAKQNGAEISAAIESWLAETLEKCGIAEEYDIPRIPAECHEQKGPISELSEMMARG